MNHSYRWAWHLLLPLLFLLPAAATAQESCGTVATPEQIAYMDATREARQNFDVATLRGTIKWIPVTFHIITYNGGTGGLDLANIPILMDRLNRSFSPANIQFFQCRQPEFIANSDYTTFVVGGGTPSAPSQDQIFCSQHDIPNTLNFYFTPNLFSAGNPGFIGGLAYFPGGPERVFIRTGVAMQQGLIEHEVGHFFALYHTFNNAGNPVLGECANGNNCAWAGDNVCDTPADPGSNGLGPCTYTGTTLDPCGQPYTPDVSNYMSYFPAACQNKFTPGQYNRMAYAAHFDRANMVCSPDIWKPCQILVTSYPYYEGFENQAPTWYNSTFDNFNWLHATAGPSAPTTGPTAAAVGSKFAYIRAQGNTPTKIAIYEPPCFDLTYLTNPVVVFQYHMWGNDIGALSLEGSTNGGATWFTLFCKNQRQSTAWTSTGNISLNTYASHTYFRMRVVASTTLGVNGDIAIDDFKVQSAPCGSPVPTISHTNLGCNYQSTGSATVSGAPAGSTYAWARLTAPQSIIATSSNITNLAPGAYQVTVTSGACSNVMGTFVEETNLRITLTATQPSLNNPNGSILVNAQGGNGAYSLLEWSGPVSGSANNPTFPYNLTNLQAGVYQVRLTDASGCKTGDFKVINAFTPAVCSCTGSVGINSLESFESGLGNWQSCNDFGLYDWLIDTKDAAPVSTTGPTTSTAPNAPYGAFDGFKYCYAASASYDFNNGDYASILLSPCLNFSGASNPVVDFYYHQFHSSGTVEPLYLFLFDEQTGLPAYHIWTSPAVSSDSWIHATVSLAIAANTNGRYKLGFATQPTGPSTNDIAIDKVKFENCTTPGFTAALTANGGACTNSGTMSVNATCTGTLSYAWSNGATTATASGLPTYTNYTVTVSCSGATCPIILGGYLTASPLISSTETTPVTLANQNNGAVDLQPIGGLPPYTFLWSGPNSFSATTEDLLGLAPGTYAVTITDAAGCTQNAYAVVAEGRCHLIQSQFPYDESWEVDLGKWSNPIAEAATHCDWTRTNAGPYTASNGAFYLYTNSGGDCSGVGKTVDLESPCIDLRRSTAATFEFDWRYNVSNGGSPTFGSLSMQISTDQGITWGSPISICTAPNANPWATFSQPLTAYLGKVIKVRFRSITGSTNKSNIALDRPRVTGTFFKADPTLSDQALAGMVLYPNPTQGRVNIDFIAQGEGATHCAITDLAGKQLSTWTEQVQEGDNHIEFETAQLPSGVYLITLSLDGSRSTKRFVVMD